MGSLNKGITATAGGRRRSQVLHHSSPVWRLVEGAHVAVHVQPRAGAHAQDGLQALGVGDEGVRREGEVGI
jgi:hypothetical protein